MEQIEHKYVEVNWLNLHVAETGSGNSPVVVFLHGFPEIWYTWRYQMIAVAEAGFRAIAPDFRGHGLSDQPPEPEKTTFLDLANDTLALLDALGISKAFLIGKDFGSAVISLFILLHGERVSGFITMGVPFLPPQPFKYTEYLPEGFYISRWREPGRAEADFGRLDAKTVVRNIYILFSRSEIPIANEKQEIMDIVQPSTPLPPWFSEEDLEIYGALYEKSGFQTALQVPYRYNDNLCLFELSLLEQANIKDPRVHIPALFIVGDKDYFLKFPGVKDYISGGLKSLVPNLQMANLPEGTHFVQEQLPDEVNQLVLDFLTRNSQS
uniref:Bifunctional epoxide hydrolase 2-like isoform X1 n=1 Tax=Nicotiana sylvestris TaxID=4096 RepID=A0A1U7YH24_NICSY|nr:PREDICTED: bifunctional epoxide hydrolase 2-like isoform X1 [Nicotiana sylvestris]